MPQPLHNPTGIFIVPDGVLHRRELAEWIGNICANWTNIETILSQIYATLLGDDLPKPPLVVAPIAHPVGHMIFSSLNSLNAKLDLLESLIEYREGKETRISFNKTLRPKIAKASKQRNDVIHSQWALSNQYPDALIAIHPSKKAMLYKPKDFEEISTRILELQTPLWDFYHQLYEKRVPRKSLPHPESP